MSGELLSRQCVHDIPVEVISRKHWGDYEEPQFNDFHVSVFKLDKNFATFIFLLGVNTNAELKSHQKHRGKDKKHEP